ncbi:MULTISPECIES: C40 family peptidase [unclassified Paenibacillus]|uniref:C40 family peptidase n=1 Tax=unclassified Paenibacillus TaxID=185978 RepID=UPI00210DEFE2|nr:MULTISPECIES: C40 family peptidase [unclassified Paenibacillus]
MKRYSRRLAASVLVLSVLFTSGCGQLSKEQRQARQQNLSSQELRPSQRQLSEEKYGRTTAVGEGSTIRMQSGSEQATIPFRTVNGVDYVVASEFATIAGFRFKWDEASSTFKFGDNDAAFQLKPGSLQAQKEDSSVQLAEPPILHNSQVLIPVSAFAFLLSDEVSYQLQGKNMILQASGNAVLGPIDGPDEVNTGSELDFEDDPNDPNKGERQAAPTLGQVWLSADGWEDIHAVPALKNIDLNGLITQAKRYIGVKYDFGADPYPQSGKFDCSTFTQYLFNKQGISLSRTARAQAKQGVTVSRKSLRKGDLMFFYVPGRFKTNKVVGHVGIYMGDQRMIHASPEPKDGVQITSINKAYWKHTYLKATRLAD